MEGRGEETDEITPLIHASGRLLHSNLEDGQRRVSVDSSSIISSRLSIDERALADTSIGERLPYNAYTTIDWLHDLVKDAYRYRAIAAERGIRGYMASIWDRYQTWLAAILVGVLTAIVAFFVDNAESSLGDLKIGYCRTNVLYGREACCRPLDECQAWTRWSHEYWTSFGIYTGVALLLGLAGGLVTKLTRTEVPGFATHDGEGHVPYGEHGHVKLPSKTIYMAAGSGIPEIKLVLSGFEFPNLLSFKVLVIKAIGASLGVASGLCLGKEGPFVHISTSAGYVVSRLFPHYHENGRNLREMLSVACSSALAVAFGSPIGGVLFVYEEMSSHFPRKVLWRAFLCSLIAAITLKSLNPNRTGKIVLLETDYRVKYKPRNYVFFIVLGICGGLFGAVFCKGSQLWTKKMRSFINKYPLIELSVVVLVTSILQYPNPITREPALLMIKALLTDCQHKEDREMSWICHQESLDDKSAYYGWLAMGSAVKILMTILTTGSRIPSGLIVPALGAGAVFGRLVGQLVPDTSPGIFAMVGASAFLAGVSRMTVSLTVIMFELTGEVEFIPPFMIAILTAKLLVDTLHEDGVNDHTVLGEFLEHEHAANIARAAGGLACDLIPPVRAMQDMTLHIGPEYKVLKQVLQRKLSKLQRHGLRDGGLVLVDDREMLHGFMAEAELDFAVNQDGLLPENEPFDVLAKPLASFVDTAPVTVNDKAPLEMVVEMFYQLGLRHVVIVEEGTSKVLGVVLKQQLVFYLESLRNG